MEYQGKLITFSYFKKVQEGKTFAQPTPAQTLGSAYNSSMEGISVSVWGQATMETIARKVRKIKNNVS